MSVLSYDNPMRRQTWSLFDLINEQYKDLEPKTRLLLTTPEIFSIKKIILTGCGDSYAAAMAIKPAFEKLAALPVEAVTAIDLSRHYNSQLLGDSPNNPLVIAISNSGNVSRVAEAVMRANHFGAFTLGITGNPDSLLGKAAARILKLDIPKFESSPGVRSYQVSLLTLLLLAIRIGEVKGKYTMDEASLYRKGILSFCQSVFNAFENIDNQIMNVAKSWRDCTAFEFVGSGSDYATAYYGHAKILEATGRVAAYSNTEEWLHVSCFMRNPSSIGTVLVADETSNAFGRALEVARTMVDLKRPLLIITGEAADKFPKEAAVISLPSCEYEWIKPLMQFVPLSLLAGYLTEFIGEKYYRDFREDWITCKGTTLIGNSEIVICGEGK